MKKKMLLALLLIPGICSAATVGDRTTFEGPVTIKNNPVTFKEISAPGTPGTGDWYWYFTSSGLFIKDDQGVATQITAGAGDNTLDDAYDQGGAGAGRTVTVDQGAVQLNGSHATNDTFFVNKTAGTGDAIQVTNAGTGNDINGTSGVWAISKTGAATFVGLTNTGAAVNLNASSNFATNINTGTSNGTVTIGGGTNSVAVNSSTWDISTAGAFTGVASLATSGDVTFATTKGIASSTTTGETVVVKGYDVDNTTYRNALTVTNGDTIAVAAGTGNETVAIDTTTWDVSTTGAFTGVADITGTAGEAMTITLASDGAADDLTLSVTGANDASVILASAGTGADAIKLNATAGGVDVDAAAAQDVNIAGGQVALVSKDDAASAISLTANIGTSETIVVTNTQGTSESAITLASTAGGVNVDAAAAKDLDLAGGQVKLVSKDDTAGAISLTANIGTSETITATNTQGTAEGAIALTSTAGGVDIDAAAAKNVDIAGGQVLISSKDNAASAIALTANVGVSETIVVTNTQGTGAGAITLTSTAGGITLNASSGITTGDAVTGDGTAALGGFLKTVTDDTDGKVLAVTESGTVQTNAGSGGAAAWTLPAAAAGLEYCFVVMAAQELRPTPAAGDVINIAGVAGDAAEYWTANAVGESLCLVAVDGTNWVATSYTGTWTQQTP